MYYRLHQFLLILTLGCLVSCGSVSSSGVAETVPENANPVDEPADPASLQTAVFAGGCFWGVEAVFEHVRGVASVRSGYAGGPERSANYDEVSEGTTGHAESVEVSFDPSRVSYEQLLDVFFKVAHNPTELNRQGPDVGSQYRSAIFFTNEAQQKAADEFIARLGEKKAYGAPIVTQVVPLEKFYEAEKYHQDYLRRNPKDPYIVYHDLPKLENLKKQFQALYIKKY